MGWREEFGAIYEVPSLVEALVRSGAIHDLSWHNDTAPSFGRINDHNEASIRLWVNHPLESYRETWEPHRYAVTLVHAGGGEVEEYPFSDLQPALEKLVDLLAQKAEWFGPLPEELVEDPPEFLNLVIERWLGRPVPQTERRRPPRRGIRAWRPHER